MTSQGLSLRADRIIQRFPKSDFVLEIDQLGVDAGKVLALLGPSGSGKSTLLRILGLLQKPESGVVMLEDQPVTTHDRAARLKMAAVFQRPFLFKGSVAANVAYGLSSHGVARSRHAELVAAALERVRLSGWEGRSALSLSGGEAQRVSLARALVLDPQVLLLDEPLASLDPLLKQRMTRDFASILREAHVTVIYVTHDQDEAMVVADSVVVLNAGRPVAAGAVDELMNLPPDDWTAAFLGTGPPLSGRVMRSEDGLMWIRCGGTEIAAIGALPLGTRVQFAVRPEDVILAEAGDDVWRSSARNNVRAVVIGMSSRGPTYHVELDAEGMLFASAVSRAAAADLELRVGHPVTAYFKATAVHVRRVEGPSSS